MNNFWLIVAAEEDRLVSKGDCSTRELRIGTAIINAINEITEGCSDWDDFQAYWSGLSQDSKVYSRRYYEINKSVVKEMTEFCKFFEYNPFNK